MTTPCWGLCWPGVALPARIDEIERDDLHTLRLRTGI